MTEIRNDDRTSIGYPFGKHPHGQYLDESQRLVWKYGGRKNWFKYWQRWIFGFCHRSVNLKLSFCFLISRNCFISTCTCLLWVGRCAGIVIWTFTSTLRENANIIMVSAFASKINCPPKSAADVGFSLWCRGMLGNKLTSLVFSINSNLTALLARMLVSSTWNVCL